MKTRPLGNSDLHITPLGLGAWAISGDWQFGWGAQDDNASIGVIIYSPMGSGRLSGAMTRERIESLPADDWRRRNPESQEPKFSSNLALVERLRTVGARHGRTPGEVAIAWTLRQPAVTGAIVGARNPAQVEGIIGAADWRLTQEEVAEIEASGGTR